MATVVPFITEQQIQKAVNEIAGQISRDYHDQNPILVCILKGAVVFLADLMRELTIPHEIDFMAISSYNDDTESSGVVRILKDLDTSIEGRNVIVIEDIVDTGQSLGHILRTLRTRNPKSLRVAVLLKKEGREVVKLSLDHVGFTIPNKFVVGYGLDYAEKYRNLPYIGILER